MQPRLHSPRHLSDYCQQARFTQHPLYDSADLQPAAHPSFAIGSFPQDNAMAQAQAMLQQRQQQQYRSSDDLTSQHWQQARLMQHYTSAPAANANASLEYSLGGPTPAPSSAWTGVHMANQGFRVNGASHMPSFVAPNLTQGPYSSMGSTFHYGDKSMAQASPTSWTLPDTHGQQPLTLNGAELSSGSEYSLSPKSVTSDMRTHGDQEPSTPMSTKQHTERDWRNGASPQLAIKVSTPPMHAPQNFGNFSNAGWQGQQSVLQKVASPPPSPADADYVVHGLPSPSENSSQDGQQYLESNPVGSQWGGRGPQSSQALVHGNYYPQTPESSSAAYAGVSYQYQNQHSSGQSQDMTLYDNTPAQIPATNQYQNRYQDQTSDGKTRARLVDDAALLKGKQDGLTYKEIQRKLLVPVAESTLRGRFRTLTKPKNARVRRPVWTSEDLNLLRKFVQKDLDRIDTSLSFDQRLAKVQWKKVADRIAREGGSYQFGNSTCKQKYREISRAR